MSNYVSMYKCRMCEALFGMSELGTSWGDAERFIMATDKLPQHIIHQCEGMDGCGKADLVGFACTEKPMYAIGAVTAEPEKYHMHDGPMHNLP